MITQWRRSTVRPLRSVSRPSSNTWRKRSQTLRVRLLELVEQEHGERLLADREISGAACSSARVAEQAVEALGGLVLAHVEPDEPVVRAEEELAEGLCDLGLARAGRADEEEHAERPRRVGEPRLHERDPVDEALDRLRLAEDAALEEGAYAVEAEGCAWIEHVQREARRGAQRRDHRLGRHLASRARA